MTKLLTDIRDDVETGTSLSAAFRKHPMYFDALYCNLVEAGEAGGILEALLDRLAIYQEKTMAIKSKIKSALIYPVAVHGGRLRRTDGDHDLRDPGLRGRFQVLRRRPARAHAGRDRDVQVLRQLLVGDLRPHRRRHLLLHGIVEALGEDADDRWTACCCASRSSATWSTSRSIARWTRTLSTMFAAGVPLVEALDSVGGASGNAVFAEATEADPARRLHRRRR